jgi:hypothetical protein
MLGHEWQVDTVRDSHPHGSAQRSRRNQPSREARAHKSFGRVGDRHKLEAIAALREDSRAVTCLGAAAGGARFGTSPSRRTPAADGDVLRSGRLDGIVGAARSGGVARGDRRLSALCGGGGAVPATWSEITSRADTGPSNRHARTRHAPKGWPGRTKYCPRNRVC